MAIVTVSSDRDHRILMCETVLPAHLDDEHSAVQLLERLAWAIEDAHGDERMERELGQRSKRNRRRLPILR